MFTIRTSMAQDRMFAEQICLQMEESAKARGTGIAKRSAVYIGDKIAKGKAFLAIADATGDLAGFCYIETWSHERYIANSGLIIFPGFRQQGLATKLKQFAFSQSRKMYPEAKLFGLTTNDTVMSINSDLGYRPVSYKNLTTDQQFWDGCKSCVNYKVLTTKSYKNCLCTALLFDPDKKKPRWNNSES